MLSTTFAALNSHTASAAWQPIEIVAVLLAVVVLALIALAVLRGTFWGEEPKYEMLEQETPAAGQARPGAMGAEDRIVRISLAIAALYYAGSRPGFLSFLGGFLALVAAYLGLTAFIGRDPLYYFFRIDSRLPERR